MGKVIFRLHKSRDKYHIMMDYSYGHGRLRQLIGYSMDSATAWNKAKMTVRPNYPNADEINRRMNNIRTKILKLHNKCLDEGTAITDDLIMQEIKPGSELKGRLQYLTDISQSIIDERTKSGIYGTQILFSYNSFLKLLREYETIKDTRIMINAVDYDFLQDFKSFLIKAKKHSTNTIWKHMKTLTTMMNAARMKGYEVPDDYKHFKNKEILTDKIYLNIDEINRLYAYPYASDRIRNSVDLFIIGCYTGLRVSDLSKISMDNIRNHRGKDMIFLKQHKTGDDVVIPIHPIVKEIIERHNGFPECISPQKLNVNIQKAASLCGIDDPVVLYHDGGGVRRSETVSKWQLVTSHTARRSFATNMHILGVNTKLIMNITGHKSEANLMKYIRIKNEDSALLLSNIDFFK